MKTVVIESPLGTRLDGTRCTWTEMQRNIAYAQACLRDSLERGEAPFASHLLYPQVYDDATPSERRRGMNAGLVLSDRLGMTAVYEDRGITSGMVEGIERAKKIKRPVEYRRLGPGWSIG